MPLSNFDLSVRFFLQLLVILAVCQATAWIFAKVGQSKVVSEMIAGVLMGPSLLDWLWPDASAYLFPKASMPILFAVAQVGLVLYMFLVGLEFDVGLVRARLRSAAFVSAAWCLLAVVLASFRHDPSIALLAVGGGGTFLVFCLVVLRRLLVPLGARVEKRGMSPELFAGVLMLLMLGAFVTDSLGIYAVFGAFLTGAAMPKGRFAEEIERRMHPLTVSFLLPLFFVYSGLNTKIGLVSTPTLAAIALAILTAAILGKGVACWGAARLAGASPRDALGVGTLMNARGLMELIILNIGLERGIILPTLFTIMVLMAVVTTLMATPIFERIYGAKEGRLMPALDFS